MTEEEWLGGCAWHEILGAYPIPLSPRKTRLWTLALCRWTPAETSDPEVISALSDIEDFIDGRATRAVFEEALHRASFSAYESMYHDRVAILAAEMDNEQLWTEPFAVLGDCVDGLTLNYNIPTTSLLRDIFGNPFRPVSFDRVWRTDTAVTLAQAMYESRDFSAMPILADALQDAGCDNADILNHCRGPGPHVRGCWVVDLVLEKE